MDVIRDGLDTGAIFSPCRSWRYVLWRRWDPDLRPCMFIGLNPSTADETVDDPTVRRCIDYAKQWGYGSLWMTNIFAYRATKPSTMKSVLQPLGVRNNEYLLALGRRAGIVVAAWGTHGGYRNREQEVVDMMTGAGIPLHVLTLTQNGFPGHPLYLRRSLMPLLWRRPPADVIRNDRPPRG